MDYVEARKILQREAELLDVLNEVTIHKGSVAYDAIKRMGQETYFEHHIMSGDAQVFDYDHNLLSVQDAQKRVFAPYEKPTVPLSDEACELAITLIQDGFGDKTFEDSPFLKLFKKKDLFADGRTNESFREFCERHIDELDDYCEKMGKDIGLSPEAGHLTVGMAIAAWKAYDSGRITKKNDREEFIEAATKANNLNTEQARVFRQYVEKMMN